MDSTEWKEATDKFVELQKEWKTIGPVVKKHSDAVWKRFIAACDHFFDEKKKQNVNIHAVEHENLKAKKEVIATLKSTIEKAADDASQTVRELMDRWQEIGHVPFKEKDKIYAQYRELVDKAFETFNMRGMRSPRAEGSRGPRQGGGDRGLSERDRLVRTYEQRMSELKTFENNMGFLTANTKSGNSLVQEMERRIAKLKEEIAELEQKIKELDNA
jgi:seryl-tRNA synthetase